MANETTSVSIGTTIPSERIGPTQGYRYAPSILGAVAWIERVPPGTGPVFEWPRWDPIVPMAGVKVESTGVFSNYELTSDHEVCVAEVVGVTIDISREAQYDSAASMPEALYAEAQRALQDRLESDVLSLATGANVQVGLDADEMTVAAFHAALVRYEDTNPPDSNVVAILAPVQWADLMGDAIMSASSVFSSLDIRDMNVAVPGYKGTFLGAQIFVTSNVATDGSARVGVITNAGQGKSGLGVAVWWPIKVEKDPVPDRAVDRYVASYRAGSCLTNNSATRPNIVALRSRASA